MKHSAPLIYITKTFWNNNIGKNPLNITNITIKFK